MNPVVPKSQRCAIYTRKSSEHNLDLEFNSLDAQREACEAYFKSQAHEGWRLNPDRYDDGGLSGASEFLFNASPAAQRACTLGSRKQSCFFFPEPYSQRLRETCFAHRTLAVGPAHQQLHGLLAPLDRSDFAHRHAKLMNAGSAPDIGG
jgi:hypothetical protein